jgi:hypothetical protein
MESQELKSLVISVPIEKMTVDFFAFLLEEDWWAIMKGLHALPGATKEEHPLYARSRLVHWSDDNPNRFNRLTKLYWRKRVFGGILFRFDAVGNESDTTFETFDPLSKNIIYWLKRRFDIDVKVSR